MSSQAVGRDESRDQGDLCAPGEQLPARPRGDLVDDHDQLDEAVDLVRVVGAHDALTLAGHHATSSLVSVTMCGTVGAGNPCCLTQFGQNTRRSTDAVG